MTAAGNGGRAQSEEAQRGATGLEGSSRPQPTHAALQESRGFACCGAQDWDSLALSGDAQADILAVAARLVFDSHDGAFRYASLDLCVFIDDKVHGALVRAIIHLQSERLALVTDRRDFSGDRFCCPLRLFSGRILHRGFMRDGRHTRRQETDKR